MIAEIFRAILIMSASGGILALGLLGAKPFTERAFGARWQFYAWFSVLVVMIIPARFEWVISLPEKVQCAVMPMSADYIIETMDGLYKISQPAEPPEITELDFVCVLAVVWAVVALFLVMKAVVGNYALKRTFMNCSSCVGYLEKVKIMECECVDTPIFFGGIHSVVFVPRGLKDDCRLSYVLAHEGVHIKRNDIFVKWLAVFVRCVHWFNPLVYVVSRQIDEACEISCDLEAVKGFTLNEKKEYIRTILEFSQRRTSFDDAVATRLTSDGRCMKNRFSAVLAPSFGRPGVYAVGAMCLAALTFVTVCISGLVAGVRIAERETLNMVSVTEKNSEIPYNEESVGLGKGYVVEDKHIGNTEPLPEQKKDYGMGSEENNAVVDTGFVETEPEMAAEKILRAPVATGEFNSEGGDTRMVCGIKPDENGCITLVIQSNTSEIVDVFLSDTQSGKEIHSFGLPVYKNAAYVMEELDPEKTYDILLKGEMRNDWKIESNYVIY